MISFVYIPHCWHLHHIPVLLSMTQCGVWWTTGNKIEFLSLLCLELNRNEAFLACHIILYLYWFVKWMHSHYLSYQSWLQQVLANFAHGHIQRLSSQPSVPVGRPCLDWRPCPTKTISCSHCSCTQLCARLCHHFLVLVCKWIHLLK